MYIFFIFFCTLLSFQPIECFQRSLGLGTGLPQLDVLSKHRNSPTSMKAFPGFVVDQSIIPIFTNAFAVHAPLAFILSQIPNVPLTKAGLLHATFLGMGLWTFLGVKGWSACVIYFVLGSLVTKIKMKEKERQGIAEKRGGARGPENVWGSAAAAMTCAMLTYIYPERSATLIVGYVASLATKLSDTFASEIGKAYGKNTYLITTLKMVPKGTEGAVSVEGTVAGVLGSIIMTAVAIPLGLITSSQGFIASIIAAFVATTAESYIGAVFQDNFPWLTNELVNLINTIIGASTAIAIMSII
mmetsp:Transcript_2303/g.2414  ORF Transcript_2303/g.2414 Transcript_2303/m.2414 type:complete len:300 (-) Transcript_2303:340-1239(-)